MAEGEGQCSNQVEPSPTLDPHTSEEQSEGPQTHEQDQGQDLPCEDGDAPNDTQDQVHVFEQVQDQEQAQDGAQDQEEAQDQGQTQDCAQDDPQMPIEELLEHRATKVASKLECQQHVHMPSAECFSPHTHSIAPLSSLSGNEQAGEGCRRAAISGSSSTFPSGGIDPRLFLLPWMSILAPFFSSLVLAFGSRFWGNIRCILRFFVKSRLE